MRQMSAPDTSKRARRAHRQGHRARRALPRAGRRRRGSRPGASPSTARSIASPALNVTAEDRIAVDGEPLPARERTRLFLYHKPRGLVTTHADPAGRPTIFAALPQDLPRLISVGRLDLNTEGLLLLTNDGGLARMLELPATGWLRRYRVRAHGRVRQDQLDRLRSGVTIDGIRYGPIEAALDRVQGSNVWLTFAIREGKNREVKNVLGHLGLAVNRLIRVSFGPFQLGELAAGAIEEVRTRALREQLGERTGGGRRHRFCRSHRPARRWRSRAATHGRPEAPTKRAATGSAAGCSGRDRRRGEREHIGEPERARREQRRRRTRRPRQEALMRIVGGRLRGARARARRSRTRDPADRRPAARGAVQHPRSCLWRPDHRCARARSLRRHRRARPRGALARRGVRAVRRRRRGSARAHPRERRGARAGRRRPASSGATRPSSAPAHPIEPFSLVFLDPPYGRGLAEQALVAARAGGWLAPDALIVVEEAAQSGFAAPEGFEELERRAYDDTESSSLLRASMIADR